FAGKELGVHTFRLARIGTGVLVYQFRVEVCKPLQYLTLDAQESTGQQVSFEQAPVIFCDNGGVNIGYMAFRVWHQGTAEIAIVALHREEPADNALLMLDDAQNRVRVKTHIAIHHKNLVAVRFEKVGEDRILGPAYITI